MGAGTIALIWAVARRFGRRTGVLALVLASLDYMMVHYSSEARGYAPAAFFALAGFLSLDTHRERGDLRYLVIFWVSVPIAFLSHPVTLFFYAGAVSFSLAGEKKDSGNLKRRLLEAGKAHVPVLLFMAVYFDWLASRRFGNGPSWSLSSVCREFAEFGIGVPPGPPAVALIASVPLAAAFFLGLESLRREGRRDWLSLVAVSACAPVAFMLALRPNVFFSRYLFVILPFLLVVMAKGCADLWSRGRGGRIMCGACLAVFLAVHATHTFRFLDHGRGRYREALLDIAAATSGPVVTVGSDVDIRTWYAIREHGRDLPDGKEILFVEHFEIQGPQFSEWVISDPNEGLTSASAPKEFEIDNGVRYAFVRLYPHYGLSGRSWGVYRREQRRELPTPQKTDEER